MEFLDGIQAIYSWLTEGIYDFAVQFMSYVIVKWTLFRLNIQADLIQFSWDIAKDIILDLQISQKINTALVGLPVDVRNKLDFFNVTSGLNLVLNALVTRFVMGFFTK